MVQVKLIFDRVATLSRKDKAGYMSADEFNQDLAQAQELLMQFYYERFEREQIVVDSLMPFLKEVQLPILNGFVDFPTDYRHRLQLEYLYTYNDGCCEDSSTIAEPYPMDYLNANEVAYNESSPIRKASINKKIFRHTFINNKIKVFPKNLLGQVNLKYLIQPPVALYAVTLDVVNQQENYDDANSINLQWLEQDAQNLSDIMLFFKAIATRESALMEWLGAKQNIIKTQYSV